MEGICRGKFRVQLNNTLIGIISECIGNSMHSNIVLIAQQINDKGVNNYDK